MKTEIYSPALSLSTAAKDQFAHDIIAGLSQNQKTLSSKYFYDGMGSKLFQQIMELPEYYLTRTETEIFTTQKAAIIAAFSAATPFDLVDLGSGDAAKTKILLRAMRERAVDFTYVPIDISPDAVQELQQSLAAEMVGLAVAPLTGDYFRALEQLQTQSSNRKVLLFLGSNIGNFPYPEIKVFLKKLRHYLVPGDQILIGFDLKKDPRIIRAAYDDAAGVTAAFNFNLLRRINQTFSGNFKLPLFKHFAEYNPASGEMKSYLVSTINQQIILQDLNFSFKLQAWEAIHTESSYKFSEKQIQELAREANLEMQVLFTDAQRYFADIIFNVS
ncbi:L-histidine N(alpha)-methyltransferase [Adhaeribacter pallidiroseus]|uniref:L-histidine N(Alpha)-methyltransferase n=1 Tax=Adhaeribacter pallidiroseus TaxID=2072847 RepID=A0A369QCJ7_9BACT|nr:L-histidine N(alpha)-methyltransferase [Adhaeribacter pallidiroseus]RDC62621.1 L-histidine N(alpha)-methyltransferase [Adhaeribacter pallidiroseus]